MKPQISIPKRKKLNREQIKGYLTPVSLLVLLISSLVLVSCGADEVEKVRARGRSLEVHTTYPLIVDKVAFKDVSGQHREIRPKASNRQLVLLDVTLVNRTSLITPLLIDEEAAQIGDRRGERIDAIDPFEASRVVDVVDPDEDVYSPFLWGQIELDREFQVQGWMVFDVPKGLILGSLWWEEVDTIITDFIDYRRRR